MTKKLPKDAVFGKAKTTTIGDRIRLLRGKETRKSLCEKLEISIRSLINYENDSREPGSSFVAKLCKIYNVTTDWLILGKDIDQPYSVDLTSKSCTNEHDVEHLSTQNAQTSPSGKKDWALNLGLEEFEELWDEYRGEREGRRGWLQVEVINRFPEFIEWLEQRQAPLTPAHIAALKKGGQLARFGPPDQPDDG